MLFVTHLSLKLRQEFSQKKLESTDFVIIGHLWRLVQWLKFLLLTGTPSVAVRHLGPESMLSPAVRGPESMLFHVLLKGVPDVVVNDLTQRLGMESVDDFLGFFSTSSFEAEIKTYVDSVQDILIPA